MLVGFLGGIFFAPSGGGCQRKLTGDPTSYEGNHDNQ